MITFIILSIISEILPAKNFYGGPDSISITFLITSNKRFSSFIYLKPFFLVINYRSYFQNNYYYNYRRWLFFLY